MRTFGSEIANVGDPQQPKRLTRIDLLRQSAERDKKTLPHLYPVPNTQFLFTADVAHLLGKTVSEVVEIPHSLLRRHTRDDGEQVFIATDVVAFIRGDDLAVKLGEHALSRRVGALLTPEDVADNLSVSVHQIRNLANSGDLPFINVGNGQAKPQMRFEPETVATFKARRRVAKCPSTNVPEGRPIRMTSNTEALDILAIRKKLRDAKPRK